MLNALVVLESVALVLGGAWLWRRARPAAPPFTRPLLATGAALLGQALLLFALVPVFDWATRTPGGGPDRLPAALAAAWWIHFLRAIASLAAFAFWATIVKGLSSSRWRVVASLLCLAGIEFGDSFVKRAGVLALFVILYGADWTKTAPRLARAAAGFGGSLLLLASMGVRDTAIAPLGPGTAPIEIALSGATWTFHGELHARAAALVELARPWSVAAKAAMNLFLLQALAALLRTITGAFGIFPSRLRLRRLKIEHRLTVTYVLVRGIPAVLTAILIALALYFGVGIQKTARVRAALQETLTRCLTAASAVREETSAQVPWPDSASATSAIAEGRRLLGPDAPAAHVVLRRVRWALSPADTERTGDAVHDSTLAVLALPEVPRALIARTPFVASPHDTLAGLASADDALYLAASLARRGGDGEGAVVEVYVPADSLYLAGVARAVGVEISLRTTPRTRVTRTATTLSLGPEDSTRAAREITVRGHPEPPSIERRAVDRMRYLGHQTLALDDWLHLPISGTGVALDLRASLSQVWPAVGFALIMLIDSGLGLPALFITVVLLGLAEATAVRMGRRIAKGIVEDVSAVTDAARRIGRGDLDHRVPVRGNDELASLAGSFNTMAEDLRRQQAELVEKERIEEDLAVAREIQARFLPQSPPDVPGVAMAGVSIPSREVGGDLYYFLRLSGGRVGIALGDVSGKSVPAALLMSSVLAGLRAQTQFGADVHEAIANMNRLIVDDIEPGRFVTFFFGVVDPAAGVIRYACAGHNPPLKLSGSGACDWLAEGGLPLGILPEAEYRAAIAPLAPGDVLVLYSDGISEAEGPPIRLQDGTEEPEQFGVERLVEAIRALRERSAAEIVDGTVDAVRRFERGVPQSDDITLVVVKVTGLPSPDGPPRAA